MAKTHIIERSQCNYEDIVSNMGKVPIRQQQFPFNAKAKLTIRRLTKESPWLCVSLKWYAVGSYAQKGYFHAQV